MTLSVAVGAEKVRVPIALERIRRLAHAVLHAEGVRDALLSIAFVTPRTISRLNRRHLGHQGPTDVIAFGFAPGRMRPFTRSHAPRAHGRGEPLVGDVYIAPSVARRNAARWGVGIREELARLVVHGVLHVAGHDHPAGEDRVDSAMWRRQEILLGYALRRSYRGRNGVRARGKVKGESRERRVEGKA